MISQKNKQLLLIGIFAIAINFITAVAGGFNHNLKLYLGIVVYFFLSKHFLTSKSIYRQETSFWVFISPVIIFQLSINLIHYDRTINSLPIHIFFLLSSITAYFYVKRTKLVALFFISIIIWFQFIGKKTYLDYRFYKSENKYTSHNLWDNLKDISNNDFVINKNKLTIIDFWNSKCAPCYRQFPFIDSISKLIDTSKIDILLLNIPLKGESKENNYHLLNNFNYTFKQIFADDSRIMDSLKIYYFPTTIVIKNNVVLFSGDFKDAIKDLTNQ